MTDRIGFWRSVLTCSLAMCLAMQLQPAWAEQDDDDRPAWASEITLYLPFDGQLSPRYAAGFAPELEEASSAFSFESGRVGQALRIVAEGEVEDQGLSIPSAANFRPARGTIAFWVKPDWDDRGQAGDVRRDLFRTAWYRIAYHPDFSGLVFMTGIETERDGFQWDYRPRADLPEDWRGNWQHIAVTWDAGRGQKGLYLNGQRIDLRRSELIRDQEAPYVDRDLILGGREAPGLYDEFMLWERPLTRREIQYLAQRPDDAAQTAQRDLPQPGDHTTWPIEFELYRLEPNDAYQAVVAPGETFTAPIPVTNHTDQTWEGEAVFLLMDFWEQPRQAERVELTLEPGERKTLDVGFAPSERGPFKIAVQLVYDDRHYERDVANFAAWPEVDPEDRRADTFFGYHINSWYPGLLRQGERLGAVWQRAHNMLVYTWWPRMQPEPGEFTYEADFHRERMQRYGFEVFGQFFGTPWWAAADGELSHRESMGRYPSGAVPDMDAFQRYVREAVERYDEITYWETWNEPDVPSFWQGSPQQFAELAEVAYNTAKEVNPDAVIFVGGFTRYYWGWHEEAAKAGVFQHADGISFHSYYPPEIHPEELEDEIRSSVEHFRGLAEEYGRGRDMLLWDSEGGSRDTSWLRGLSHPELPPPGRRHEPNWREAALANIQGPIFLQKHGVERSFQYYWQRTPTDAAYSYHSPSYVDVTNAPKPKLMVQFALDEQIRGASFDQSVERETGRLWAGVFQKENDGGSVVAWWTGRGGEVRVEPDWSDAVERRANIMGNPIDNDEPFIVDEEPSYVHLRLTADEAARAVAGADIELIRAPGTIEEQPDIEDEPEVPDRPGFVAPLEAGEIFTIDLRPYANMDFADETAGDGEGGWADEGPLNDARDFPTGEQTFLNVPFDIIQPEQNDGKAVITLQGRRLTPRHPEAVRGIEVGRERVRMLYFLHAAAWGRPGHIGHYVIHYEDGEQIELPLEIQKNIGNWWTGYDEDEQSRPIPFLAENTRIGEPQWRYVRLWEWDNPRRDVAIESIDFVSEGGAQTPILIAITGIQR